MTNRIPGFLALLAGGVLAGLAVDLPVVAAEVTVEKVEVAPGDTTLVTLHLDQAATGSAVSTFAMSNPDRLVVDIADARVNPQIAQVAGGGVVDRVEVTTFDDGQGLITRVMLYLDTPTEHKVKTVGSQVLLELGGAAAAPDALADALGASSGGTGMGSASGASAGALDTSGRPLSGPERTPGGPAISSLDFKSQDDVTRVVIGLQGTSAYNVSEPQANLIVVDVPGAFLPQSLGRVLDASEFISPVQKVRAYRTSSGARVAISLRTPTQHTVRLEGGLLYVDVVVPPEMREDRNAAAQESSGVSPSSSEGGLSSAYNHEVMIGSGGRTIDPQAAFGTGGGSQSPSSLFGMSGGFMVDNSSASDEPYSGRRISLDFVNADIHSIFRLISHVSRLNIVAGDDVTGQVTVRMVDVPWDQALAAILQAKGLGSQRFGNIVRVAPIETIKSEQQAAVEAKHAQEELTELQLLVLPLNYQKASDLKAQVMAVISTRGSVEVDAASNQLIIKETEDRLAQVRELVRVLDKQTPQVLIEARVVEASSNFARALGVQWGSEVDATTRTGYSTGLFFPNGIGVSGGLNTSGSPIFYSHGQDSLMVDLGADASNSSLAFSLGSIPGLIDLDARLSALETDGWGKVVSSPRITTLDNKTAVISQGQKIPFLSTSAGGTNVQFIQASLELKVTPHITSDDKVFLSVAVSNNRADFSQLIQGQPAIQIKEAETELLVADGDTTVLGGVFASEQSFNQDRTPGLGKIPLLGYLFKNSQEAMTRNELLVFITPHIVTRPASTGG